MTEKYIKQLQSIATLRETKGKEAETLEKISHLLPILIEEKEWKYVAQLYWESHLVWQHTVMNELAKQLEQREERIIKEGTQKMAEFAEKALKVIEENNLHDMQGGAYRFLGRAATYAGRHDKAKEYYEKAINSYTGESEKSKLEVSGFLAESLIRQGEAKKGLELAKKTYNAFLHSDLGKKLKKDDYFLWVVWMSGIAPRTIQALVDTNSVTNKDELVLWLNDVKTEIKNPKGVIKWGDKNFGFRVAEIENSLKYLDQILLLIAMITLSKVRLPL